MNSSPDLSEIAAALSAAQGEFTAAPKDSVNPHYKNSFASLKSVVQSALPVLSKHGLSITQLVDENDTLTLMLMHKSGQWISSTMSLHPTKDDVQGWGSGITYARRYSFMAALGLVADEDDDGQAASRPQTVRGHEYPKKPQTQRRPPPVVQMDPKRQLLAACAGDKDLAARLWTEALEGSKDGINDMEFKLLLSRAQAEVDGGPFE